MRDTDSGRVGELRARCVVVADGSNSRFGRALGTSRERSQPMGMALRGYYRSPGHDDPFIESHLDIRDAEGEVVPGYGWIFPMGDGRVNVGVGLLSTDRRWKGVNTSRLMDAFVKWAPERWELSPETCCGPPTGGKLPMGLAVGPHAGPNVVVVGDAGGSINPFNGEGIAYAYETGRLAAAFVGESLSGGGPAALLAYEQHLADAYGPYYEVARAFVRVISHPEVMRLCVGGGLRSELLMARAAADHGEPHAPRPPRPGRGRLPRHGGRGPPGARARRPDARGLTAAAPGAPAHPPSQPAATSAAASPATSTTRSSSRSPWASPGKRTS